MRFIYTDEAGTSAKEPLTVVAGVLVQADTQWAPAARRVMELRETVPEPFRDNFVSHAKSIWGDKKYRDAWPLTQRIRFLCEMMSVPWQCGLTLAWATIPRTADLGPIPNGLRKEQYQHACAFRGCMAVADQYMREHCPQELATIVAEDVEDMRKELSLAVALLISQPQHIPAEEIVSAASGSLSMNLRPDGGLDISVTRIVDDVHFSAKTAAVLLQVADACAFGLRRYNCGQSTGDEFAAAIYGPYQKPDPDPVHQCLGLVRGLTTPIYSLTSWGKVTPHPSFPG